MSNYSLTGILKKVIAEELQLEGRSLQSKCNYLSSVCQTDNAVQQYVSKTGQGNGTRYVINDTAGLENALRTLVKTMQQKPQSKTTHKQNSDNSNFAKESKKTKQPLLDDINFYFSKMLAGKILSREEEVETGRALVSNRYGFSYAVLRNPHSAKAVADDISQKIAENYDCEDRRIFEGQTDEMHEALNRWSENYEKVCALEELATTYEENLKHANGVKRKKIIVSYNALQKKLEDCFKDIRIDFLGQQAAKYTNANSEVPELDEKESIKEKYAAYRNAQEALAQSIARFGIKLAKRYIHDDKKFTEKFADLMSIVHWGIIDSIERWNPERGFKLATYAGWWIKQKLIREGFYLKNPLTQKPTVVAFARKCTKAKSDFNVKNKRLPTDEELIQILFADKYAKAKASFISKNNRQLSDAELTKILKKYANKLTAVRKATSAMTSINCALDEDGTTLGTFIAISDNDENNAASNNIDYAAFWPKIEKMLTSRELKVIKGRYIDNKKLDELGEEEGVSRERIRQIEFHALERLREHGLELLQFYSSDISKTEMAKLNTLSPRPLPYEGPNYKEVVENAVHSATGLTGKELANVGEYFRRKTLDDPVVSECIGKKINNKYPVKNEKLLEARIKELIKIRLPKIKQRYYKKLATLINKIKISHEDN